jgi:hypothetical protein
MGRDHDAQATNDVSRPVPDDSSGATTDASPDVSPDEQRVVGSDASLDARSDVGSEVHPDANPDAQPTRTWDWVGIVGTGQSLAIGAHGTPIAATRQPYRNLMLSLGNATVPPFDPMSTALSMVPLVEPLRATTDVYPSAYPANLSGETPHTAMASQITALYQQLSGGGDYVTVHTEVGENGQPMRVINKTAVESVTGAQSTGRAYAATLFEASAISRLARAANKTYGIGAIIITHGESDAVSASYETSLFQLWSDYNQDLPTKTGQTARIPMLVSQQHSVPANMGSTSPATVAQWKVGVDHPGDIICSGPKYQYPYFSDGVHLPTKGYEMLGEKYGEVFVETTVLGRNWQPLQPIGASHAGSVVTVQFHVPVPPLVWDDKLPSPHLSGFPQWTAGRGFEVSANGTPVAINSAAIVGDTVQITCGRDLSGLSVVVAYAHTADGGAMPGGTFRWGHLRDSDPLVGATTHAPNPNYCVSFSMPAP